MGEVVEAGKENFEECIASGLVLVDFWAESCRPCVALAPRISEIASERPGLKVVKLDAAKARRLCMSYRVAGLPTLMIFRDGQESARLTDTSLTRAKLDKWLAEQLDGGQLDGAGGEE
jgi:thioredoxin-like negative regulator of GroEL